MWTRGNCVASACGWKTLRVRAPVSQGSPVHISTSKHPKAYMSAFKLSVMTADTSGNLQDLHASLIVHCSTSTVRTMSYDWVQTGAAALHTQYSTDAHPSTAQHSTAQHSTARHSRAGHSRARHNRAQHSMAQHSTARHNRVRMQT